MRSPTGTGGSGGLLWRAAAVALLGPALACGCSESPVGPEQPYASAYLTPAERALEVGDSAQFQHIAIDSLGDVVGPIPATWSSSNRSVATIDTTGLLIARSPGTTTIKGEDQTTSALLDITVTPRIYAISVRDDLLLIPGTALRVDPALRSATGETIDSELYAIEWSSSDSSIVSFREYRTLVAGDTGTVTVGIRVRKAYTSMTVRVGLVRFVDVGAVGASAAPSGPTCALTDDGRVFCWAGCGPSVCGADAKPVPLTALPPLMSVSGGASHRCGLTTDQRAFCWGGNAEARGAGNTGVLDTVRAVSGGHTFSQIAVGGFSAEFILSPVLHTCALDLGGAAYCWGDDRGGVLGAQVSQTCYQGGAGIGEGGVVDSFPCAYVPTAVSGNMVFSQIVTAATHSCALTAGGVAYCWGTIVADSGQSDTPTALSAPSTFTSLWGANGFSCGVTGGGEAYCWGDGLPPNADTISSSTTPVRVLESLSVASVRGSWGHACALATDGTAYCWGRNAEGQLGQPPGADVADPSPVQASLRFTKLELGYSHTCGLSTDSVLYCWGTGSLGTGSFEYQWQPTPVIGQRGE